MGWTEANVSYCPSNIRGATNSGTAVPAAGNSSARPTFEVLSAPLVPIAPIRSSLPFRFSPSLISLSLFSTSLSFPHAYLNRPARLPPSALSDPELLGATECLAYLPLWTLFHPFICVKATRWKLQDTTFGSSDIFLPPKKVVNINPGLKTG